MKHNQDAELGDVFNHHGACHMSLAYTSNGRQGGDAGHGSFLELSLETDGSASIDLNVWTGDRENDPDHDFKGITRIRLRFSGDDEISGAVELLRRLADELSNQSQLMP